MAGNNLFSPVHFKSVLTAFGCAAILLLPGLLPADDLSAAFNQAQGLVNQAHAQGANTAAAQQQLNQARQQYLAWQAMQARQASSRGLQNVDPFGDFLFHGVPIQPVDGRLVTRSWDHWGQNEFGPLQAPAFAAPQDTSGSISRSPLAGQGFGGPGAGAAPRMPMALPPPEVDAGAVRIGNGGTVGLLRQQDPNASLQENSGVRQVVAAGQFAHMSPAELDAVAAANPDLKPAIQKQKALNQSRENLGALADQVGGAREAANEATEQGDHDATKAGAVAVGMAGVPGAEKIAEHLQGEASGAQVAGDVAKDVVVDQGKDLIVDVAKELGANVPVVKVVLAVPEAIKLGTAGNSAIDHYTDAAGLNAQVQAAGGTAHALDNWNAARNQSLDNSSQIYQQLQQKTAPPSLAIPPPP